MDNQLHSQDFIVSNLPKSLPPVTVAPIEDGGVYERFLKTREEFPREVTVLTRKKAEDYPASCARTFYVAPNGDDRADGTLDRPFATLARALEEPEEGVGGRIIVRGGTYVLSESVILDGRVKSAKDAPLFIEAYENERPIFTSARAVTGADFVPVTKDNTDSALFARFNTFEAHRTDRIYVADLFALGFSRDELGEITAGTSPILYIDGEAQTLARYPNKNQPLLKVYTEAECILKQCKVPMATSELYRLHRDERDGFAIAITEDNEFYSHASKWPCPSDAWLYAALYEEWHHAFYPIRLTREGGTLTVKSQANCIYGLKSHPHNKAYFANLPEELDEVGEWYLDRARGKLYIYRDAPLSPDAEVSLAAARMHLFDFRNTAYTVLDGLTFCAALGCALSAEDCHDLVMQNCCVHDTAGYGFSLKRVQNTALIFSEFYRTGDAMVFWRGLDDRRQMSPDRNIVQNCRFHTPNVQRALDIGGVLCAVSHNSFRDTNISLMSAIESVCEYNDFDRGSQTIYDSGPIYCGSMMAKGMHIRYNYLHDLNYSKYGIYLDDLASANYVYGNIVVYARENTGGGKCVNIHGGNQNVIAHNLLVNATDSAIKNCPNYYVKKVYDRDGRPVPCVARVHTTAADGTHKKEDKEISFGGGLGYRWVPLFERYFEGREDTYLEGTGFADRLPNSSLFMRALFRHHEKRREQGDSYNEGEAVLTFSPRTDTRYPWGDESLCEFLVHCPDDDLALYLRSSAYNVYVHNIFLGCAQDIVQYTVWDLLTSEVRDNCGLPTSDQRFEMALDGEMALLSKKESWLDVAPDFEEIPFEKIGLTE